MELNDKVSTETSMESNGCLTLPVVSLLQLVSNEQGACETLLNAAASDGCFYLDISSAQQLFDMAEQIQQIADRFFNMPVEEKMMFEMDRWTSLHMGGYKATGKHSGVERGKRDGFENFLVPLNALTGISVDHMPWPEPIQRGLHVLTAFELRCHQICHQILEVLTTALPLLNRPLEQNHRLAEPTTTSLAMLKYPPSASLTQNNAGHMAHTDVGSLTLLFTKTPGLEIFRASSSSWIPVPPLPNHVIVNFGDALSFMSGGRFHRSLHRVLPITQSPRFSLAFFLRPELTAKFEDGEGRQWTGESWHRAKYQLFRADNEMQGSSSLLTGRKNFLGHLDVREYTSLSVNTQPHVKV